MSPTGNHQGVIAQAAAQEYVSLDDIFRVAEERSEVPLIVVCDGIEDPHNLGAIIRSAETAGAHGVIIPKRRAVGLTAAVARSAAAVSAAFFAVLSFLFLGAVFGSSALVSAAGAGCGSTGLSGSTDALGIGSAAFAGA